MTKTFITISLLFFGIIFGQSLQSISPDNALQGQELSVTITGENTHFGQGTPTVTAVWFSKDGSTIDGTPPTSSSNTSFNADFDIPTDATVGSWDVNVQNPTDGTMTLTDGFSINASDPAPAAPTLLLPANGSTIDDYTPTLDWSEPTYAYRYHLIVDDNSDFSSPVYENTGLSSSTSTPFANSSPLSDGQYYW